MPNLFQKLKQNFSESNKQSIASALHVEEKNAKSINKQGGVYKLASSKLSSSETNSKNSNDEKENKTFLKAQTRKHSIKEEKNSLKTSQSVLSLIIDGSILNDKNTNGNKENLEDEMNFIIFDPEPAKEEEESETFDKLAFLDDRSFILDDISSSDSEVTEINNFKIINNLARENSCYTINEIPEGRLSTKINSSRASSRSSLGSGSTRTSSNFFEQGSSDHGDNMIVKKGFLNNHGSEESGKGSAESGSDFNQNGSKNAMLDALLRKFNVNMDMVDLMNQNDANLNESLRNNSENTSKLEAKTNTKYNGEDQKRKKSELQKKINRTQLEKQLATINKKTSIADDEFDKVDATSSFDDCPKEIKIIRSTGTQMSQASAKITNFKQRQSNQQQQQRLKTASLKLPQNFECKYIGKAKCQGLWGIKNIREPVDRLVKMAKRHKSLNELTNVEALVSEKGIYIIHKSSDSELNSKPSSMFMKNKITTVASKIYKSGLLPISNISYAAQDNIYSKIFSCIVVQEREAKTLSECYSFLCARNDIAKQMALSITLAFKDYAKLLQLKESRINQMIKLQDTSSICHEPDSFA